MGEYIVYYSGKIVGGIYDDRFLVKPVKSAIACQKKRNPHYYHRRSRLAFVWYLCKLLKYNDTKYLEIRPLEILRYFIYNIETTCGISTA